jgi:integrase/recombinase XerD
MSKAKTSSRLARAIARYLTHKSALGHRCHQAAWFLRRLRRYVQTGGQRDLNTRTFDRWLRSFQDRHPNTRRTYYRSVRLFCLYRRRHEPGCFVPSAEGMPKPQPYVTPVIVEPVPVARMLALASQLPKANGSPLRAPVLRLAIVLLYTCGLRLGELRRLTLGDIEQHDTVLRIRESKFHKSRLVPLSPTATRELKNYLRARRKVFADDPRTPLLCNRRCGPAHAYSQPGLQHAINHLFEAAQVRDEQGRRPRVHDLRHSFAVQALIRWYQNGADVQSCLPKLALYMGHVSIESSAYYLHWVPTLQRLASQRFEQHFGHLIPGEAR